MSANYLQYYERYSPVAPLAFAARLLLTRSKRRRLSLANRQKDYLRLAQDPDLLKLHYVMNARLAEAQAQWGSYDYGEGYFYQGCSRVGVTGLRDTNGRVHAMRLKERVADCTVVDIGCNTGFLALSIADSARFITGFDINPHLIAIGEAARAYLGCDNVRLLTSTFENFELPEPVQVVLSLANHSTYDGNTRHTLEAYFDKCRALLVPGGRLLFESHPPAHEGNGLEAVRRLIAERLVVEEEEEVLQYGGFLDRNRTFLVARRPD